RASCSALFLSTLTVCVTANLTGGNLQQDGNVNRNKGDANIVVSGFMHHKGNQRWDARKSHEPDRPIETILTLACRLFRVTAVFRLAGFRWLLNFGWRLLVVGEPPHHHSI